MGFENAPAYAQNMDNGFGLNFLGQYSKNDNVFLDQQSEKSVNKCLPESCLARKGVLMLEFMQEESQELRSVL
jgi:hypothetical protein